MRVIDGDCDILHLSVFSGNGHSISVANSAPPNGVFLLGFPFEI